MPRATAAGGSGCQGAPQDSWGSPGEDYQEALSSTWSLENLPEPFLMTDNGVCASDPDISQESEKQSQTVWYY